MKRKKLTIYHTDGTEEVILGKASEYSYETGYVTAIGYALILEDGALIMVQPTLHRKIKIEEIECQN